MSNELERLLARVHKGISTFEYGKTRVPCILLEEKRFDEIISGVAGRAVSINTDLNILQNGLGQIFVEVVMQFSVGDIKESVLINANTSLEFFELLAETSMFALSSPNSASGKSNIFMVQLPRPERAADALEIIQRGLKRD